MHISGNNFNANKSFRKYTLNIFKLHLKLIWSLSDFSWTSAWTSKSYVRERDCQHNGSSTANSKVKENFWTYPACRQWHSRSPWTSDFWKRCATKNITGKINLKAENEPWKQTENCFSIKCWVKSKCVKWIIQTQIIFL